MHLATLRDYNHVIWEEDIYWVGPQFLMMGGYAQREIDAYPAIKEKVDWLAVETDERTQFIVEENGQRVYLYTKVGQSAVQTGTRIGKHGELYTSAAKKAILPNLPEERVHEIIDMRGLSGKAGNTITSKEALFETLEEIRERGYAFNKQETTDGVHAIGAAVTDANDEVLGALSVANPVHRLKDDTLTKKLPEQILGTVNELEPHIQHSANS